MTREQPNDLGDSRIHLVASAGGHLELLERLSPAFAPYRPIWITHEGSRAEGLAKAGADVRMLPRMDRRSVTVSRLAHGARLALRERPRVIVTTGAGVAVPFSLIGRAMGADLVFIETMARVTAGSATGRTLARVTPNVFVQWPELSSTYPRAQVCSPLLLEELNGNAQVSGRGTFVTVGAHDQPFDRLISAALVAAHAGILPKPITVQQGVARIPSVGARSLAFVSPQEFHDAVAEAEVVVCHGGAGAIATVLRAGKRPIVMARRHHYGEHVDDHQLDLVAKLASVGLIVSTSTDITLDDVDVARKPWTVPDAVTRYPSLEVALTQLLERLVTGLPR